MAPFLRSSDPKTARARIVLEESTAEVGNDLQRIYLLTSPFLRLIAANTVLFGIYFVVIWFVMGQKAIYLPTLREVGLWPVAGHRNQSLSSVQVPD